MLSPTQWPRGNATGCGAGRSGFESRVEVNARWEPQQLMRGWTNHFFYHSLQQGPWPKKIIAKNKKITEGGPWPVCPPIYTPLSMDLLSRSTHSKHGGKFCLTTRFMYTARLNIHCPRRLQTDNAVWGGKEVMRCLVAYFIYDFIQGGLIYGMSSKWKPPRTVVIWLFPCGVVRACVVR